MNCLWYKSSAAIVSRRNHVTMKSYFYGFSTTAWRRGIGKFRAIRLDSSSASFRVQCFSAKRARPPRLPKAKPQPSVEEDKNAFCVVRKGGIAGIYKSLRECQDHVSSSVCDPSLSVYKGNSMHKETEDYLASRGLKDALYSMHAADLKEDLLGTLVPCLFQQPDGLAFVVDKSSQKTAFKMRSNEMVNSSMTCILESDGASKGNPRKAGAGAILRTADGSVVARLREGLGVVTNNAAEYQGLILGMKHALKKGFKEIQVQGDSNLVCMQVQGLWRTKNQNMAELCTEVKRLKKMLSSFKIGHVLREFNSDADNEANLAINLQAGEVCEECENIS